MAPPSNRRPGYSRRAQYGTFFGYVIAAAGALVGGVLLLVSSGNGFAFGGMRSAANDLTAPAGQAAAATRSEAGSWFNTIAGFFTSGNRVAKLEQEVALSRVKLAEAQALANENARLKEMLGLVGQEPKPVVVARLIASTSTSSRRFALLGAGSQQGVRVGMPVRSPLGLVGRVLEVGNNSSRVLLITDGESMVPVRRATDGLPAYASGKADGTIQLRLINAGINTVKIGDAFVTSGQGGLFRPGTAVAVVSELTRDGAVARPLSDPGSTEFVAVYPLWDEAQKGSELKPEPGTPGAETK